MTAKVVWACEIKKTIFQIHTCGASDNPSVGQVLVQSELLSFANKPMKALSIISVKLEEKNTDREEKKIREKKKKSRNKKIVNDLDLCLQD